MHPRLLAAPLVAATLLSALSCSKKDEPAARTPLVGTGSYKYDGTPATCQVSASTSTGTITSGAQTGKQQDYLEFTLQPTPQLPTGESARAVFAKPAGQPNTAYVLSSVIYYTDNTKTVYKLHSNNIVGTLTEASSGSFSGTDFSSPSHNITAGTFADVRP